MTRILASELARFFWGEFKRGLSRTRLHPMAHVFRGRPLLYGVSNARLVYGPGVHRVRHSILISDCHDLGIEGAHLKVDR